MSTFDLLLYYAVSIATNIRWIGLIREYLDSYIMIIIELSPRDEDPYVWVTVFYWCIYSEMTITNNEILFND